MKHLKLFESWSEEFLYDFTDDKNFTIEEDGKKVKGEFRGSFDVVDMSTTFTDVVSKMSTEYKILKAQSFFNQVTGNAKFEIEVQDKEGEFIEITVGETKVKWSPEMVVNLWSQTRTRICQYINIEGRLENGAKRTVLISFHRGDTQAPNLQYATTTDNLKMKVTIGGRYRGVSIDKENVSKLVKIISENPSKQSIWGDMTREDLRQVFEIAIETLTLFT
jgi:hypothetical protein